MSSQLADTDQTRQDVVAAAIELGCTATEEHPGYVRIVALNGRIAAVGTANGPWQADVYSSVETEQELVAFAHLTIPASHVAHAEGIARYVVGALAGIYEYMTIATEREARRVNRRLSSGRR